MPSRIVREGILDSERIGRLSVPAELFYRKLMSVVDDYGRFEYVPSVLRARLYSQRLDSVTADDIEQWMGECSSGDRPLVMEYAVGKKRYLEVQNFNQQLRAKISRFPPPTDSDSVHARVHPYTDEHSRASFPPPPPSPYSNEGGVGETEEMVDGWAQAVEVASRACMAIDPSPHSQFCQKDWKPAPLEEKMACIRGIYARIDCNQFGPNVDPQYITAFRNFFKNKGWNEGLRPRNRASPDKKPGKGANLRAELEKATG